MAEVPELEGGVTPVVPNIRTMSPTETPRPGLRSRSNYITLDSASEVCPATTKPPTTPCSQSTDRLDPEHRETPSRHVQELQLQALPLSHCMLLGKVFKASESQFSLI